MLTHVDRRSFGALAVGVALSLFVGGPMCSGVRPTLAARLTAMREAMAALESASRSQDTFWQRCGAAGLIEHDAFWDWYQLQPVRAAYQHALERAWAAVEAAFMTVPETHEDDDGVMHALASYELIAPSAFAMQCARDLFTPPRYQSYPHDASRHWLLSEPDEMFAKSPMPGFVLQMRDEYRRQPVV